MSAVASIVEAEVPEEIDRIMAGIPDTVASFYMFGLAASLLRRRKVTEPPSQQAVEPPALDEGEPAAA